MKSYSELKAAVGRASSPEQASGTFIDSWTSVVDNLKDDPEGLSKFTGDIRSNRQSLVHILTKGGQG